MAIAVASPPPMHSAATPLLAATALQRVDQGDDQAGAAGADRMAQGAGAAVDVQLGVVDAQLPHRRHGHGREGLVDLEQVHVADLPASLVEHLLESPTTGAVVNHSGACGVGRMCATMRASGFTPRAVRSSAPISTSAAAPSLMLDELAAVMVPSFLKAGRRRRDLADVALARLLVGIDDDVALATADRHRRDLAP